MAEEVEVVNPKEPDSVDLEESKEGELDGAAGADSGGSTADTTGELPVAVPGPLSHRETLRDQFEFSWRRRLEPAHRLVDQLIGCLRSRAQLERQYANSILQLAKDVNTEGRDGTVHDAMEAAMVNFRSRGEQSLELADEIEEDIVVTLEVMIEQHREVAKRILTDMQRVSRYCQDALQTYERSSLRYSHECWEAEQAANEFLHGEAMRSTERTKVAMRGVVISKRARMAEHDYYQSIEQANRAQSLYDDHMPIILQTLREMDEKREKCVRDCLMKLCVYEASWLRNLQYDLEAAMKTAEVANAEEDVKQVYESQPVPPPVQPGLELVIRGFWELPRPRGPQQNPITSRMRLEGEVIVNQQVEVMQPPLHRLLKENPLTKVDEVKVEIEPLHLGLAELSRRSAFCRVLHLEVMASAPEGVKDLDGAPSMCITQDALEILAGLIKAALDGCNQAPGDSWNGKHLILLCQRFHAEAETGKTTTLLSMVYSHPMWSRVTFWEEVLLIAICEAFGIEAKLRRTMPPGQRFFQRVMMTSFLTAFMGHMLTLGIRPEQARSSVQQTLRKHMNLLGPAADVYTAQLLANLPAVPSPVGGGRAAQDGARDMVSSVEEEVALEGKLDDGSHSAGESSSELAGLGVTQPTVADVFA
mmetsp:Transcript_34537/g.77501  ORF Transcript_34537/g.77501 Transcript_34537/m.77501 type:complete len:646 (-) Transcript_34537:17-1954(-)